MKQQKQYFWTVTAVENDQHIYGGERFDFKKMIIAISAILNSTDSATLHVYALEWWLQHKEELRFNPHDDSYSARLRFIAKEIQRAISPEVTVKYDETFTLGGNSCEYEGCVMFTITGKDPLYTAYGQHYIQKEDGIIYPLPNGAIGRMKNGNYFSPLPQIKPLINIGPKTEQTEYIETFADLDYGIFSLKAIRNRYPYAVLYIGVKENGTIIDPRSVEETQKDITDDILEYIKAKDILPSCDGVSFNVDKIGNIGVVQLLLGGNYHKVFNENSGSFYFTYDTYVRDNFEVHESHNAADWREIGRFTPYSLYELESPTRNLSFGRLKKLLTDNGIQWEDFETEFGVSLLKDESHYNMFAYLMNDITELSICAPYITGLKLDLHGYIPFWDSKERWFFERINDVLDYIRSLNRLRTINVDGTKMKFQYFNFEDAKEAYLCACIYHDWASQFSPLIHALKTSLDIYCFPILHKEKSGKLAPKKNEVLARLMKMYGLIDDTDISFSRLQEKFGPKSINYTMDFTSDKGIRIRLPIGPRVQDTQTK